MEGFTKDELVLDYESFSKIAAERRDALAPEVREWLAQWEKWDLACSPMNDIIRRFVRHGHHLGWFHHKNKG